MTTCLICLSNSFVHKEWSIYFLSGMKPPFLFASSHKQEARPAKSHADSPPGAQQRIPPNMHVRQLSFWLNSLCVTVPWQVRQALKKSHDRKSYHMSAADVTMRFHSSPLIRALWGNPFSSCAYHSVLSTCDTWRTTRAEGWSSDQSAAQSVIISVALTSRRKRIPRQGCV